MAIVSHVPVDSYDASGGINTVSSSLALKPNESRDAQDVDFFPIGGFSKRNGYARLSTTPSTVNPVTGLFMARYTTGGGKNIAFMAQGGSLYSMSSALGGTWTDITNGLTISSSANDIWTFSILNDICVLGNGTNAPIQISSTPTATALTSGSFTPTNFKFCAQSRGYMWYFVPTVSGTVHYDRGYFSDLNDPTTVQSTNFVDVHRGQGGDAKGALEFKTYFYVWKRHGIYQLIFQPTQVDSSGNLFPWVQNPNPVVPGVGTQSHQSIVKFSTPSTHPTPGQEYVFFIDQFGVPRIFDGATTLSFSSKIGYSRDTNILSLSDMDQTRAPYAFSVNYPERNKILCFLSQSNSQQDTCWVMDYSTGFSIGRYSYNEAFNIGTLFEKSNGKFKPFVGSYSGEVHELDSGTTDNGAPIYDYRVGVDHFYNSPGIRSNWPQIDIRGKTGDDTQKIKVGYYLDGGDTVGLSPAAFSLQDAQTKWGDSGPMIWGKSSWAKDSLITRTSEINTNARTIRVKFESLDKLNDTYVVEGYTLWIDPRGRVKT